MNTIIGSNETALAAAAETARKMRFAVKVRTDALQGEARDLGARLAHEARVMSWKGERACLLLGGETSVTVRGGGVGGRNTELALAFAINAQAFPRTWFMALTTDGIDGPTPAAGAIVGPDTLSATMLRSNEPVAALESNDSYTFLRRTGAILHTGPTETNVADIAAILVNP